MARMRPKRRQQPRKGWVPSLGECRLAVYSGQHNNLKLKPEDILEIGCGNILREWARPDVLWHHNANESQRSGPEWAIELMKGFQPGLEDMTVMRSFMVRAAVWDAPVSRSQTADLRKLRVQSIVKVEFKTLKGRQTQQQKDYQAACLDRGIPYYVITNKPDFWDLMLEHDMLRPLAHQQPVPK